MTNYLINLLPYNRLNNELRQNEKDKLITILEYIDTAEGEFIMIISPPLNITQLKRVVQNLSFLSIEEMTNKEVIELITHTLT